MLHIAAIVINVRLYIIKGMCSVVAPAAIWAGGTITMSKQQSV